MRLLVSILLLSLLTASAQERRRAVTVPQQAASAPSYPTPDILQWNHPDGSGTTSTATLGPNLSTDASWSSGWVTGNALDFNGTSQDGASVSAVSYGTNIVTVCFPLFLRATNTHVFLESSTNFYQVDHQNSFAVYVDAGQLTASMFASGTTKTATKGNLTTGAWFSVMAVLNNSTNNSLVGLYFDGTNANPSTTTAGWNGNLLSTNLYIGARNRSSLFTDGKIGKVWIYSGDRSANASTIADAMK